MQLLLNGQAIDLRAPHELMTHLGKLRTERFAEMRIEADDGSAMVLVKNDDRALVRYLPRIDGPIFLAQSEADGSDLVEFRLVDGSVERVAKGLTLHVMEAYQALVHFLRSGGMSESLQWQQAA